MNSLSSNQLPNFSDIYPENIVPALKQIIAHNRAHLSQLLSASTQFTWDNLMAPLEEMGDRLSQFWSPVAHLHAVCESEPLRAAYNQCLPLLSEYHTEFMQNETLYHAMESIAHGPEYSRFDDAQKKVLNNYLRDFRLTGVHLPPLEKAEVSEYQKQLTQLSAQFAEHLIDATQAFSLHITDPHSLQGLPEQSLKLAEQNAEAQGLSGWVFTLDYPSYSSVIKYLANRELRWLMHEAYTTRASDQGPYAGQFDNTQIMEDIIKVRTKYANALGFKHYADYSLATKMAKSPEEVLQFLQDLVEKSKPFAVLEIKELEDMAKADGITLETWDLAYYTEKLRVAKYAISQEDLRAYFPINKVMEGMFKVVQQLFGIKIIEQKGVSTWHPQVQYFTIVDENNQMRGAFYTDLYARAHKREGAWMDECRVRRRLSAGVLQTPIAFLTCNFSRPINNAPALLTHDDVQTLFHEFGHTLHHLLTQVDYAAVSGINGVPWDAVEFPSQFLEQWCFEKEVLNMISAHAITGEPLPDVLYNKLIAAKNYQAGLQMLRQLEFALFDFKLHLVEHPEVGAQVQKTLDDVRKTVSVIKVPKFNRFQHSFSHIFSGAYAAGYYSYKWAEVLSADAFSLFLEKGTLDPVSGRAFLKNILEQGGVYDPMQLFMQFRGRAPKIEPLLHLSGL